MGSVIGIRELRDSLFMRVSLVLAVNGIDDCREGVSEGGREGVREGGSEGGRE